MITIYLSADTKIEYKEIDYPKTDEILGDIEKLSKSIECHLKELKNLL